MADNRDRQEALLDAVWNYSNQLVVAASTCTVQRVVNEWKASGSPEKVKGKADLTDAEAAYACIKQTMGVPNGKNSKKVQFCADCHNAAEDNDSIFFLPEEFRIMAN